jgi:acyl carrier protein
MTNQTHNSRIEERIRSFVSGNLLYSDSGFPYADDTSFLQEGIIDSLGVMELVAFVQKEFEVKVDQKEVTRDHFDSVTRLAAFVRQKQADAREYETSASEEAP